MQERSQDKDYIPNYGCPCSGQAGLLLFSLFYFFSSLMSVSYFYCLCHWFSFIAVLLVKQENLF